LNANNVFVSQCWFLRIIYHCLYGEVSCVAVNRVFEHYMMSLVEEGEVENFLGNILLKI
jgi:hypothetical protein